MRLLLVIVAVTLLGAAGLHLGIPAREGEAFLPAFGHELEMALLVACVLAVTVELLNRHQHKKTIDEINRNVLSAVLQRNLPEALYREVDRSLLKANFYRENYLIEIGLIQLDVTTAQLKVTTSYEVVNMSGTTVDYNAMLKIDLVSKDKALCRIVACRVGADADADPVADFQRYVIRADDYETFNMPIKLGSGKRRTVSFTYETIGELIGSEAVCCVTPSTGLTLRVITPQKNFNLLVETMHMSDATLVRQTDFSREWRLNEALLPCQGLQLQWKHITAVATAPTAPMPAPAPAPLPTPMT